MSKKFDIKVSDENHIWINGTQYISLNRVSEIRLEMVEELKILKIEAQRLYDENEAFKVLLREQLEREKKECAENE